MRTFSALRALCSYEEVLRKPKRSRDEAADRGTEFHAHVQRGVEALRAGGRWEIDAPEPMGGWLRRMRDVWTPPLGIEMEVAMGLADEPQPRYVPVEETEPHVYVPTVTMAVPLLTAGRADLVVGGAGSLVHVDDIKTGQFYLGDPRLIRQLLAQGIAATLRAGADGFIPGIYYARLGIFDRGDGEPIWRDSLEWDTAWDYVVDAARMPAEPRPGGWCLSCWSRKDCSANPERKEFA